MFAVLLLLQNFASLFDVTKTPGRILFLVPSFKSLLFTTTRIPFQNHGINDTSLNNCHVFKVFMPWPVFSTMTLLTSHFWLHRYLLPNNDVTQVRISDALDVSTGLWVTGPLQINSRSELSFTICCFCATYWSDTKLCTDKAKKVLWFLPKTGFWHLLVCISKRYPQYKI